MNESSRGLRKEQNAQREQQNDRSSRACRGHHNARSEQQYDQSSRGLSREHNAQREQHYDQSAHAFPPEQPGRREQHYDQSSRACRGHHNARIEQQYDQSSRGLSREHNAQREQHYDQSAHAFPPEQPGRREQHYDQSSRACRGHHNARIEQQYDQSMAEMEAFYKKQLKKARSDLKQTEEEFQSFKDRVAGEISLSMKTGDSEVMNSPVNKARLKEMYDQLKYREWCKIRDHLKSNGVKKEFVTDLIKNTFEDARVKMEEKKKNIDKVFEVKKPSRGSTPQKVAEFKQLTVQNLQMSVFLCAKEDLLKTPFPDHQCENPPCATVVTLRDLEAECYRLGCLMALSCPPLQPDWEKHVPGPDAWDIFPSDLKNINDLETEETEAMEQ
ncbi:uncharacterized protein LOC115380016 [Myripristis murdjan]|uniref:uncharacterized protein LOC115380016 n=1 Tax=Myripristis murdjan TaxID=586833 RepID=UPI001175E7C2|nr:uncharacterized protein LOC115380016 [Myripristis murdjan]